MIVIGTPGGSRIITAVLQTILNTIDYGMDLQEAVDAPRFHQQWLPEVTVRRELRALPRHAQDPGRHGPQVRRRRGRNHAIGIMVGAPSLGGAARDGNRFYGANDPRRNTGLALGY